MINFCEQTCKCPQALVKHEQQSHSSRSRKKAFSRKISSTKRGACLNQKHTISITNVFTFPSLRNERAKGKLGGGKLVAGKIARTRWKMSININKNKRRKAIFHRIPHTELFIHNFLCHYILCYLIFSAPSSPPTFRLFLLSSDIGMRAEHR